MKTCSKCKRQKEMDQFSPSKITKDGKESWCKRCKADLESQKRRNKGTPATPVPIVTDNEKECLLCHTVKPLDDFPASARGRQKRGSYCIPCNKEFHAKLRARPGQKQVRRDATRKYRAKNPERWRFLHRCNMQARRARKRQLDSGLVTKEFLLKLYEQENCHYCQKPTPKDQRTCDHKIPLIRGGPHHPENLVMACGTCNSSKQDKTPDEWERFKHQRDRASRQHKRVQWPPSDDFSAEVPEICAC